MSKKKYVSTDEIFLEFDHEDIAERVQIEEEILSMVKGADPWQLAEICAGVMQCNKCMLRTRYDPPCTDPKNCYSQYFNYISQGYLEAYQSYKERKEAQQDDLERFEAQRRE